MLRNDGTITALGHSQSTGAEKFLIVPHNLNRGLHMHI